MPTIESREIYCHEEHAMDHKLAKLRLLLRLNSAYLDPGSGSYLLQLLIAGILGALFVLRGYFGRIKSFIAGLLSTEEDEGDHET